MKMIYIGDGSFLHGVPARDLTEAEVERFGAEFLLASGLYKTDEPAIPNVKKPAVRDEEA